MKTKKIKKDILTFNAVFLEEADGGYSVSVPVLPGCFSQGDTFEEAVKNIKEAIELYIEEATKKDIQWSGYRSEREFMAPVGVYA
ncbi:MAG: type II toxin-antitoxin system HicB family antitoxin [Patescibacteria group bacterium]